MELIIVKIGGNIINDDAALTSFLNDFSQIQEPKILIHGGGKSATALASRLGIETMMQEGRRITDAETLKVVTMVYAGLINKNIVAQLQSLSCNAIGLCGADANLIPAHKRTHAEIDYGCVGDVIEDDIPSTTWMELLKNTIPVIAPITHDGKGQLLNTNADSIASAIAIALSKEFKVKLIYCFEKKGVLADAENEDSLISELSAEKYIQLKQDKKIINGMIPKLDNAFEALLKGVQQIRIGHATEILKMIKHDKHIGTKVSV